MKVSLIVGKHFINLFTNWVKYVIFTVKYAITFFLKKWMSSFIFTFVYFIDQNLDTYFQVKITHNSFCWFSIKQFDTVKYEVMVWYLFMTRLITNSSLKYGQICWTRPYIFVKKKTKYMVPLNIIRKIYPLNESIDNITAESYAVKQPNFWNDLLVLALWKQTNFYLFTETISFSQ